MDINLVTSLKLYLNVIQFPTSARGRPKPYTELFTEYQIVGYASQISFGLDNHHWVCIKSYPPVKDTTMWFWFKILFRLVDRHKVGNFKLVLVSIQ